MKGDILFKVLKIIKDFGETRVDLVEAILVAGYGASQGQIKNEF